MIRKKILSLSVFVLLLLSSCEKVLFNEDLASKNPKINFEYLWNECNEKYSYFDVKEVDWNKVKIDYSGKVYSGMTEDSLFNVLGSMLKELKDDHANLVSDFNTSFYGIEYLAQDNFNWRFIVDNYITKNYYISGPFAHNFLENKEIGYVRLSSFEEPIDSDNLNFILDRYKNTKGLILDIRENGGGAIANVFAILSRFVESETQVFYSVMKSGSGHNDFTEPSAAIVKPYNGARYTNNVIVLTDRGTYSSGSLLALATKALPNIALLGDTTGGGLGMPNGGQLPNGWTYRFSITQTLSCDKKPDYEKGVPPDIMIQFDWNDLSKDEILEMAVSELL